MTIQRPAIFASAFFPHVGGVEELTRQLAVEQQGRGLSPTVVTMRWPKQLPAIADVDGVPVLRHVFRVPEPSPRFLAGWLAAGRRTQQMIVDQLRDREVDLIHVQCVSNNARYALHTARTLDVPLVVTMQGELTMDATGLYQRSAQQRRSWRRLLDAADGVTGCSQSVLDDARAAYDGNWVARSRVVPNGVRVKDFDDIVAHSHDCRYVFGIGRMVAQKGFDVLIRAFAQIAKTVDADLLLAGDGPELGALRSLALELDVAARVTFLGSVDRATAARTFAGASAFVLPSRLEPQGIVILEAMASGVPVIATRVGGVPETVIDGDNGLLVAPDDAAALGRQMLVVLGDSDLSARLTVSGRRTALVRDWGSIAESYEDRYRDAAEAKDTRPPQ